MILNNILKRKRLRRTVSTILISSILVPMFIDAGVGIQEVRADNLANTNEANDRNSSNNEDIGSTDKNSEVAGGSEESNLTNLFDKIEDKWVIKANKFMQWGSPISLYNAEDNSYDTLSDEVEAVPEIHSVLDKEPIYEYDEDGVLKYPHGDPYDVSWYKNENIYENPSELVNETLINRKGLYYTININDMSTGNTTTVKVDTTKYDYDVYRRGEFIYTPVFETPNYNNLRSAWSKSYTYTWHFLYPDYVDGTTNILDIADSNFQFPYKWYLDIPEHCEWYYKQESYGMHENNYIARTFNSEENRHSDNGYVCEFSNCITAGLIGGYDFPIQLGTKQFYHGVLDINIVPCEDILEIDPNGGEYNGTSDKSQFIERCTEVTSIEEPVREGYIFDGWEVTYKDTSNHGEFNEDMTEYTHEGNRCRYVLGYLEEHRFNYNSGGEYSEGIHYEFSDYIPEDTKYRYTHVENLDRLTKTTLKAKWKQCEYNFSFIRNAPADDNESQEIMARFIVGYNVRTNLPKNTYTVKGYHFLNWNTASDGSGQVYEDEEEVYNEVQESKTITLYAQWESNSYYFRYNGNTPLNASDTVTDIPSTEKFLYNIRDTLKGGIPHLTGWQFKEWRDTTDSTGNLYESGKEIYKYTLDNDVYYDLYAQWEPNKYRVTFDSNKPLGTTNAVYSSSSEVAGSTVDEDFTYDTGKALNSNGYSLEGWTFSGWTRDRVAKNYTLIDYTDGQRVINLTKDISTSLANTNNAIVTLYAQWRPNSYYIDYESNIPSGVSTPIEGMMAEQEMRYDKSEALSRNQFILAGYLFTGWNTKADGSGDSYTDSQEVINLSKTDGAHITLYAQWVGSEYTIHYNKNTPIGISNATHRASNVVEGEMEDTNHPSGVTTYLLIHKFSLKGWKFTGWTLEDLDKTYLDTEYADGEDASKVIADYLAKGIISKEDEIQLYAQWRANRYLIKFDSNGGQGSMLDMECSYDKVEHLTDNAYTYEDTNYNQTTYNKYAIPYNHSYQTAFEGEFMQWESNNGNNTLYYDNGQRVLNLAGEEDDQTDIVTMYAIWNMLPNINIKTEDTHLLFYEGARISSEDLLKKVVAYDKEDGDITDEIEVYKIVYVNGDEDTNVRSLNTSAIHIGTYTITYRVQDKRSLTYVYKMYTGEILYNNVPDVEVDFMDRYMYRQDIEALTMRDFETELGRLVNISDIEDTGIDNSDPTNADDEKYWGDIERRLSVQDIENVYREAVSGGSDITIIFTYFDSYGKPNTDTSGRFTLHIVDKDVDPAIEENSAERYYVRFISEEYKDTLEQDSIWRGSKEEILEEALGNTKDNAIRTFEVHK